MLNDRTQLRRVRVVEQPAHKPVAHVEFENGIVVNVLASSLPLTIGRSASCDLSIPSGHVSRKHCELSMAGGVLRLKDTSSNGTQVDDRTIHNETVSITRRTEIMFAGDVRIVITPTLQECVSETDRRSESDRRQDDRRQESVVVKFERRTDLERRLVDRRAKRR